MNRQVLHMGSPDPSVARPACCTRSSVCNLGTTSPDQHAAHFESLRRIAPEVVLPTPAKAMFRLLSKVCTPHAGDYDDSLPDFLVLNNNTHIDPTVPVNTVHSSRDNLTLPVCEHISLSTRWRADVGKLTQVAIKTTTTAVGAVQIA